jgi:hypothetical protein
MADEINQQGTNLEAGSPSTDQPAEPASKPEAQGSELGKQAKAPEPAGSELGKQAKAPEPAGSEPKPEPEPEEKPIEYSDFELPEGAKLDDGILTEFKTVAAKDKLSQEQAQAYVKLGLKVADNLQEQAKVAFDAEQAQWNADRKARPDYEENEKRAYRALVKFLPEESERKEFLDSWLADYPVMRKILVAADRATSEGNIIEGGHVDAKDTPLSKALWGNSMEGMGSSHKN